MVDRRARFELIYSAHAPAVKAYVLRRAQTAIADDVVADVFTVCWRRLEDMPADPLPWLIGVAARVLRTHRRAESRRSRLRLRLEKTEPAELAQAPDSHYDTLGGALRRMRDDDRELLLLIAWDGLTPHQAAAALGISAAAVRVRLHRARNRLRLALERPDVEIDSRTDLSMEASS